MPGRHLPRRGRASEMPGYAENEPGQHVPSRRVSDRYQFARRVERPAQVVHGERVNQPVQRGEARA